MENDILLFDNQKEYIDLLTDTQAGQLLKAIYAHNRGEDVTFSDPMVQMAFMVFWKGISNGRAKRAKLRSNGSKGGRPKTNDKPNDNQTETKEEPKENQNESLNLNLKCDLNNTPISSNEDISPKGELVPASGKLTPAKKKQKRLVKLDPPTVEEVREYCIERGYNVDAAYFVSYYSAQDWKLSNGRDMSDWKSAVDKWDYREKKQQANQAQQQPRFANYGQQLKWEQDQQAKAINATRDLYKDNPEDIPPEWR